MRTLRKGTAIIRMVGTSFAKRGVSERSVQGNTRMTVSFKDHAAMGTSDDLATDGLMTAGTIGHQ
mgnify:CR=1 FL=1